MTVSKDLYDRLNVKWSDLLEASTEPDSSHLSNLKSAVLTFFRDSVTGFPVLTY